MDSSHRRRRVWKFTTIFLGVVYDFWRESRLARRYGLRRAREVISARHRRRAIKFREAALSMGGVLIKLGQFLSARADVMPEEYIEELTLLQDTVPPVAFDEIRSVVESEFGRPLAEVFTDFDPEAMAAASLAQVHRAKIPSGETVAVKIQRPGVDKVIDVDLATLSYLMDGLHRFTRAGSRWDIPGLVEEFARTLGDELDFYREGFNAARFGQSLADTPSVIIPRVYWDYTRDKLITLEWAEGVKISDYEALEAAGIDRSRVAEIVIEVYLKMVLEDGFFHADPHPGNLFVLPGPVITFVDFGMVGEITPDMRQKLKQLVIAGTRRNVGVMVGTLSSLGFIRKGANVEPIRGAIAWLFDHFEGLSLRDLTYDSLEEIQEEIRRIVYENPFTIPTQFAFLGRAGGTLLGLATGLDPNIDFVEAAKPYVQRLAHMEAGGWERIVVEEAKSIAKILVGLPQQVQDVLTKMQRGDFGVRFDSRAIVSGMERQRLCGSLTAWSVSAASFLLGSVILYVYSYRLEAGVLLFLSAVVLAAMVNLTRSKRA